MCFRFLFLREHSVHTFPRGQWRPRGAFAPVFTGRPSRPYTECPAFHRGLQSYGRHNGMRRDCASATARTCIAGLCGVAAVNGLCAGSHRCTSRTRPSLMLIIPDTIKIKPDDRLHHARCGYAGPVHRIINQNSITTHDKTYSYVGIHCNVGTYGICSSCRRLGHAFGCKYHRPCNRQFHRRASCLLHCED